MALTYKMVSSMEEVDAAAWDALGGRSGSPFLSRDWLSALESSGCVAPETGWTPKHLTVWDGERLVAGAPLYLKDHSRGEFVFDQEWADVSHRLGVAYYPKLLGMSPFTPAGAYRFLIDEDLDQAMVCAGMLEHIDQFCHDHGVNSCHFLHVASQWRDQMVALGVGSWLHHALVWENHEFKCFDDYLASFNSKRRKSIKRERRKVAEQGLVFKAWRGTEVPTEYFALMYFFYAGTCRKFWGWSHYLNQQFFLQIGRRKPDNVVLIAAIDPKLGEVPVAMSFLVHEGEHLYGRYWGCREEYDHLHFETCYYQAIEWAIANGVRYYDAGSGNAGHKQRRGFPASPKYSLHRHYDPIMKQVWKDNIQQINEVEQQRIKLINREIELPERY